MDILIDEIVAEIIAWLAIMATTLAIMKTGQIKPSGIEAENTFSTTEGCFIRYET